ncbi:MAG TPA: hypothetical protein VHR84_16505 [Terriglobales bacterium]|jgi:hypothetical protein|nr:hypothetical protein [Terriglobales bacterium]
MPERRGHTRASIEVTVELWGRNDSGAAFTQSVKARNISVAGALLVGVQHKLRCGDVISIVKDRFHARFRVVWTRDSGTGSGSLVAIHKVNGQQCPWIEELQLTAQQ